MRLLKCCRHSSGQGAGGEEEDGVGGARPLNHSAVGALNVAPVVAVAVVTARADVARRGWKWREAAGAACWRCRSYITDSGGERGANDPLGRLAAYMRCCATRKMESKVCRKQQSGRKILAMK